MNEVLSKDIIVRQKDLELLIREINKKNLELKGISLEIQNAKEELGKEKERKNPVLASLDKQIAEREKRVADLEINLNHAKKLLEEDILSLSTKAEDSRTTIKSLGLAEEQSKFRNKELLETEAATSNRILFLEKQLPGLELETNLRQEELNGLRNIRDSLTISVQQLEDKRVVLISHISELDTRQGTLDKYHRELSIREKELEIKEGVVEDLYQTNKTKLKTRGFFK